MGPFETLGDVGLRIFLVTMSARKRWIAVGTSARRFVMRVLVRLVAFKVCLNVNVGRLRRRGNAGIEVFGVITSVINCWHVGNIRAIKGVTLESVGSVRLRGEELALVGKKHMKECLVMLLCHCVGLHVIRCFLVASIGVQSDVTAAHVLELAELLSSSPAGVEA